jgi:hypothetical protein
VLWYVLAASLLLRFSEFRRRYLRRRIGAVGPHPIGRVWRSGDAKPSREGRHAFGLAIPKPSVGLGERLNLRWFDRRVGSASAVAPIPTKPVGYEYMPTARSVNVSGARRAAERQSLASSPGGASQEVDLDLDLVVDSFPLQPTSDQPNLSPSAVVIPLVKEADT